MFKKYNTGTAAPAAPLNSGSGAVDISSSTDFKRVPVTDPRQLSILTPSVNNDTDKKYVEQKLAAFQAYNLYGLRPDTKVSELPKDLQQVLLAYKNRVRTCQDALEKLKIKMDEFRSTLIVKPIKNVTDSPNYSNDFVNTVDQMVGLERQANRLVDQLEPNRQEAEQLKIKVQQSKQDLEFPSHYILKKKDPTYQEPLSRPTGGAVSINRFNRTPIVVKQFYRETYKDGFYLGPLRRKGQLFYDNLLKEMEQQSDNINSSFKKLTGSLFSLKYPSSSNLNFQVLAQQNLTDPYQVYRNFFSEATSQLMQVLESTFRLEENLDPHLKAQLTLFSETPVTNLTSDQPKSPKRARISYKEPSFLDIANTCVQPYDLNSLRRKC